jgi:ATP-dependent RNA circularization protein (DNA/RNA ligase family)
MKFYRYKNGEVAFFAENKKHIITDEEIKLLYGVIDKMGYAIETFAGDYIAKKINTPVYCEPKTIKMIQYMHEHNVSMKVQEGTVRSDNSKITFEKVYEGETLVAWIAFTEWGDKFSDEDMPFAEIAAAVDFKDENKK